jgi:MoaA/NifB/PqqE/SkfB family radical SAM enzyme
MGRIVIELTNRCNLRCQHCLDGRHGGKGEIPLEIYDKILHHAKRFRFDELAFTGGEPTTHKKFFEIVAKTVAAGYTFGFVSNGWNFPKIYERLLPYRDQLRGITFSMDGAREATHDQLRGKGSYRRLLKAMSICVAKEIPFAINMVLTKQNYQELEELVSIAPLLGSGGVRFGHLLPTARDDDDETLELSSKQKRAIDQNIRRLQHTASIAVAIAPGHYTTELFPCAPLKMQEFNIDWQGNVTKCCHLSGYPQGSGNNDVMGNLNEMSLPEAMLRLRRSNVAFRQEKEAHFADGNSSESDYFPCLYCCRYFDKLESTEPVKNEQALKYVSGVRS